MSKAIALSTILAAACCSLAAAADMQQSAAGAITADKVQRKADQTLVCSGNVTVVGSSFKVQADSVEVREIGTPTEPATELTARGNVILTRGQERMTLQQLQLNSRTGVGTFQLPPAKN